MSGDIKLDLRVLQELDANEVLETMDEAEEKAAADLLARLDDRLLRLGHFQLVGDICSDEAPDDDTLAATTIPEDPRKSPSATSSMTPPNLPPAKVFQRTGTPRPTSATKRMMTGRDHEELDK